MIDAIMNPYLQSAVFAFIETALAGALTVGLTVTIARNHFAHRAMRPAVGALALLFLAMTFNYGIQFVQRLMLADGDAVGSLAVRNSAFGVLSNILLMVAMVAVFITLAVLYPNVQRRTDDMRTRSTDA